ncbi:MAG TPA: hypothetical protein VLJ10_01780, partial [Candidatus Bathyarchaeia archaeon]|nr:hypothetical protein [Candidatus Bathyarchaeia archaeon]
ANYLSTENRLFLRSIDSTLREVFTDVRSIPGDTHTFLVSNLTDRILLSPRWFSQRLTGAGLQTQFVTSYAMPLLLDQRRIVEVEQVLAQEKGFINRDLFPQVYLFQMILWSTHFGQGFSRLMTRISVPFVVVLAVGILIVSGLGFWKCRQGPLVSVDLAVGVSGFSEILFQLIVILIFQALYGIAYERIGLILGSFMLGLVVGTKLILGRAGQSKPILLGVLKRVQVAMVVYPLLLPLLFFIFREARFAQEWMAVFSVVFACVPFVAGMLGGMQYPLATLLRQDHGASDEAPGAGRLYAFDVFGAAVGALLAGTLLVPLYGIVSVCLLCAALNAVVLIFLWKEKASAA